MKPVKICCFSLRWSSGGIESFLNNCILNMDLTGIEVDIVSPCIENSVFTQKLKEKGVCFYPLSGKCWAIFKNGRMLKKLFAERHYSAVHFNLYEGLSLYYCLIAKRMGIKTRMVHAHQSGLRKSLFRPIKHLIHKSCSLALAKYVTERFACSKSAAEFFFPAGYDVTIIPNGIDCERFRFEPELRDLARSELGINDEPLIGTIGRLSWEKNHDFLLDIFKSLQQKVPKAKLLIVGTGDLLSPLVDKAKRLEIADNVIFYGETDSPERLLAAMDVFVMPSLLESFGMAAAEAQASGLFTICSDIVPPQSALTPLFSRLPLSMGAERWADEILSALGEQVDRRKYAAYIKQSGFDAAETAKRLEIIYRASASGS